METNKTKKMIEKLGERIRELRQLKNMSQRELSSMANIDKMAIVRLENAQATSTLPVLLQVCDALSVSLSDLLYEAGFSEKYNKENRDLDDKENEMIKGLIFHIKNLKKKISILEEMLIEKDEIINELKKTVKELERIIKLNNL